MGQAKRLVRRFSSLADDCDSFSRNAAEFGVRPATDRLSKFLRSESKRLGIFRISAVSRQDQALITMKHVLITTGNLHDKLIADLLNAVCDPDVDNLWTVGALEQLRLRDRRGPQALMENVIAEYLDADLQRSWAEQFNAGRDE